MPVIEPVSARLIAGNGASVVVEQIFQMRIIERERLSPIWISTHATKRHGRDGIALGGIEIHVFLVAFSGEEVVANPTARQRRQCRRIEVKGDLIAGTENRQTIIIGTEQRLYISVAGVGAGGT